MWLGLFVSLFKVFIPVVLLFLSLKVPQTHWFVAGFEMVNWGGPTGKTKDRQTDRQLEASGSVQQILIP